MEATFNVAELRCFLMVTGQHSVAATLENMKLTQHAINWDSMAALPLALPSLSGIL